MHALAALLVTIAVFSLTVLFGVTVQAHTVQPCTEDGITLRDGTCSHPDRAQFDHGYWTNP